MTQTAGEKLQGAAEILRRSFLERFEETGGPAEAERLGLGGPDSWLPSVEEIVTIIDDRCDHGTYPMIMCKQGCMPSYLMAQIIKRLMALRGCEVDDDWAEKKAFEQYNERHPS